MFKKVALLCFMILMVSCARQTSDQIFQQKNGGDDPLQTTASSDFVVLWQNYGSDVGNTNVVNGKLPAQSASLSDAATEAGFSVFSSPVIFQDSSTNAQFVVALWARSDQLKVVRYIIGSSTLTQDSEFTAIELTPNEDTNAHQGHQIALSIENDVPFIFVGHNGGVSKYNALTGALVKTVDTYGSVFRLLVSGESLYIQSRNYLVKLNAVSMDVNFTMSFDDPYAPNRQLPLVISGNYLYVVHGNDVIKVNLDSFTQSVTEPFNGRVAGLVAVNDTVIYSVVSTDEFKYPSTNEFRRILNTEFRLFGGDFDAMYYDYITQRSKTDGASQIFRSIGDASFTAIAVTSEALYLPGFSFEYFTNSEDWLESGVVVVNQSTKAIQSVYGNNQQQVYDPVVNTLSNGLDGFGTHYVSRFVIVDSSNANVLSVMNVNEYFFQLSDSWGNTITQPQTAPTKLSDETAVTFDFGFFVDQTHKNKLDAYNSSIKLGNSSSSTGLDALTFPSSTAIQAVSVGDAVVVLAGSDSKLYLLQ